MMFFTNEILPDDHQGIARTAKSRSKIKLQFLSRIALCLAKNSTASKMARFASCLGLKREPGRGQESLLGARRFSLGKDLGICGVHIFKDGRKLIRIRQPDRSDDAARRGGQQK